MIEFRIRDEVIETGDASIGRIQKFVIGGQLRKGDVGEGREQFLGFRFGLEISAIERQMNFIHQ